MKNYRKMTLGFALRSALKKQLEDGWLYLPDVETPTADTECLLMVNIGVGIEGSTRPDFPVEGLDTQLLEDVSSCAASFENPPSQSLLVESFIYYWRYDAWLPFPGAPEPELSNGDDLTVDKIFYDFLGEEDLTAKCKSENCPRGRVSCSIFCRVHHFEMIKKKPCVFSH